MAGTFAKEGGTVTPGSGGDGGSGKEPPGATAGEPIDLTTAAGRLGWGTPVWQDEFNYAGSPDPTLWSVYNSPGHDGNGLRRPSQATVDGSKLVLTGEAGSALSAGMESKHSRRYGRWEWRARSYYTASPERPGDLDGGYHPVTTIWAQDTGGAVTTGVPIGQTTRYATSFENFAFGDWASVQTHSYDGSGRGYSNPSDDYRLKIVDGAGRPHVLRTEVHDGDTAVGSHERAEVSAFGKPWNSSKNAEEWFEFDVRLGDPTWSPSWSSSDDDWIIIFQWHQVHDEGSPALALAVHRNNKVYLEREADDIIQPFLPVWTVRPGQWEHVIVHVKWSPDPSVGFVHIYVNGVETVAKTFCKTMYTSDNTDPYYVKCGQYRRAAVGGKTVVMHDNIRVSTLPVATTSSSSSDWPHGGEYDPMENGEPGQPHAGAFHHFPSLDGQDHKREMPPFTVDMRQWNNFAFEWAASGLRGWINGQEWYSTSGGAAADRKNIQDMKLGALTFQLDAFQPTGLIASTMEVDWVRAYDLAPTSPAGGGGSGTPVIGPPLTLTASLSTPTTGGSPRVTTAWKEPGIGTAVAYQVHELRKHPNDTLKATVTELSRTSGGLQPATLEYAIKAVDAAGNVSAFSNTVIVVITAAGVTISPGQPAGWDSSGTGTGGP